ncbi:MAG: sigma-70 family RNA polymerase sigma factor, partial [Myxococcota bacterium]
MAGQCPDLAALSDDEVRALVASALSGDRASTRTLVQGMAPIVQLRVFRSLVRRSSQARGRGLRADVEDLVQGVFESLFARQGKALKAWDPERGLSFPGYVAFLAEREVGMVMRRRRRNPWTEEPVPESKLDAEVGGHSEDSERVEARQFLSVLAERLRERLSPQGRLYFQRLYFEQKSIQEVAREQGTTPGAL